jgi:hypothetical protein
MTIQVVRQRKFVLTLRQCREARKFLAPTPQPRGVVRRVAPGIVRRHLDLKFGNRQRPEQIGGEPTDVGQTVVPRDRFDGSAHHGDGWTGVLVLGVPGTPRQLARTHRAGRHHGVGRRRQGLGGGGRKDGSHS